MGRPYHDELQELTETYREAFAGTAACDLAQLLISHASVPWCFVGSGGAHSAARYMASAYEHAAGRSARLFTPQDLLQHRELLSGAVIVIVSASGNNKDIVAAFEAAVGSDAEQVVTVTASGKGKIARAAAKYSHASSVVVTLGGKKDGFLALNSILSFAVSFAKACHLAYAVPLIPSELADLTKDLPEELLQERWREPVFDREVICVLHGSATLPAAVDFESKATEAGLVASLVCDHRNFGHGRHHWLAKHGARSSILAFCDKSDQRICERTLTLIPKSIPRLLVATQGEFLAAGITALIAVFHAIHHIGSHRRIDPGRPGVPSFGSKIYSLGPQLLQKDSPSTCAALAIRRKASALGIPWQRPELAKACATAATHIESTLYDGLVFDYDGTVVGHKDRLGSISKAVGNEFLRLLEAGAPLTVCTGRGKSAHKELAAIIPKDHWSRVLVCFYNGSVWCSLSDDATHSEALHAAHSSGVAGQVRALIAAFHAELRESLSVYDERIEIVSRDYQVTIESKGIQNLAPIGSIVQRLLLTDRFFGLKCLASAHSLDVIPRVASKRMALGIATTFFNLPDQARFLAFGDMPSWPGNDCELLSDADGLSVGKSSPSLIGGWNFASSGARSDLALVEYLSSISYSHGSARMSLSHLGTLS